MLSNFMAASAPGEGDASQATNPREARRAAFEELSAAQEAISVKGLIDFRTQTEVSQTAQMVMTAAASMVAGIDPTVGVKGQESRTWKAAQNALAKPGHFVNSLRRLPYAVDSARLAEQNVTSARSCLEAQSGFSAEELQAEPVVQHMYRWVLAALSYYEVSVTSRPKTSADAASPTAASPKGPSGLTLSPLKRLSAAKAPSEDGSQTAGSPSPGAGTLPGRATGGFRNARGSTTSMTSMGGRSSVASTKPEASPRSATSSQPRAAVTRRPVQSKASVASTSSAAPSGHRPTVARTRIVGVGVPAQAPASGYIRPSMGSRQNMGSAGYPARQALATKDLRAQVENLKRETLEVKALEAQIKASMLREDKKEKTTQKTKEAEDLAAYRKEQNELLIEAKQEDAARLKVDGIIDSREYQEHKRMIRVAEKEEEHERTYEEYLDHKENSEWHVELNKMTAAEHQRAPVEEHLDQYRVVAEAKLEEKATELIEVRENRISTEQAQVAHQMMQAQQERDAALSNLEYIRAQQSVPVTAQAHILPGVK